MLKRIFHLFLCFVFPFAVFVVMLYKVLFTNNGLGENWLSEFDAMLIILRD